MPSQFAPHKQFPSTLDDDALVQDRLEVIREDMYWRQMHVDMDKCEKLYDRTSSEDVDGSAVADGIPRGNFTRRAVEDYMSVALQNIPKAKLQATRKLSSVTNPIFREILAQVIDMSEQTVNAYVKTILQDNHYDDMVEAAVRQSAIYGVGYIMVAIDSSMDVRFSYELRDLLRKPFNEWTEEDANLYNVLSNRVEVKHVDSRDVVWQYGRRKVDENMLRVSIIERASTEALKVMFDNENIRAGEFPWFINEDPSGNGDITAVVTTWELEPVHITKEVEDESGEVLSLYFGGWQMLKTVIAGGQLVDREVTGPFDGEISLPIVPFYLRESERHPYGYSLPLMLELSEEFINLMRLIIYKSAKNSVSPQGVIVNMRTLGPDDMAKINRVLEEGGVAAIEGNFEGPLRMEDMVMPLNYNQSSVSVAAVQAMQNEMETFKSTSNMIDMDALNRSESGAAKRAQIQAHDRPKTISLGLLSRAVEDIYDRIYELVREYHSESVAVSIQSITGGREQVRLNQQVEDSIPVMDGNGQMFASPSLVSRQNPLGLIEEQINYTINDTTLPMRAQAEGRGHLPIDPFQRFNVLFMYLQTQTIELDTFRELVLDERMKALDDRNRERNRQQMQTLQQAAQQPLRLRSAEELALEQGPQQGALGLGVTPREALSDQRALAALN